MEKIFGDYKIIQYSKQITSVQEILDLKDHYRCQEVVAVLPYELLHALTNNGVYPLIAKMIRNLNNKNKPKWQHSHFIRLKKLDIETEKLRKRLQNKL